MSVLRQPPAETSTTPSHFDEMKMTLILTTLLLTTIAISTDAGPAPQFEDSAPKVQDTAPPEESAGEDYHDYVQPPYIPYGRPPPYVPYGRPPPYVPYGGRRSRYVRPYGEYRDYVNYCKFKGSCGNSTSLG